MKYLISISILLIGINGFCQENVLENRHSSLILTKNQFFESIVSIDTIVRQKFHSNGVVSEQELIWRIYSKEFGDTLLWWLERRFYKNSGQLKRDIIFGMDSSTETTYDEEGFKTFQVINMVNTIDSDSTVYHINKRGSLQENVHSQEFIYYHKGRITRRGKAIQGKKNGTWEYFDKKTGALSKSIKYDNGKKISIEKF